MPDDDPNAGKGDETPNPKPTTDNVLSILISESEISPEAKAWIRTNFNPSGDGQVRRLKLIAAFYMTEVQRIRDAATASPLISRAGGPAASSRAQGPATDSPAYAARQAAISLTHIQTASMFAVLAATERLP